MPGKGGKKKERGTFPEKFRETHPSMVATKYFHSRSSYVHQGSIDVYGAYTAGVLTSDELLYTTRFISSVSTQSPMGPAWGGDGDVFLSLIHI